VAAPSRSTPHPLTVHGGRPPAIGEHRLLSSGSSTALVQPDATIDWWCAPEPDSSPLLWSLLDPRGPAASWAGARYVGLDDAPAGATSRTTVAVGDARVECWDGLLSIRGGGTGLVRLARSLDGAASIEHHLAVGPFGDVPAVWHGDSVHVDGRTVRVLGGRTAPGATDPCALVTSLDLGADASWAVIVITVDGLVDPSPAVLAAKLAAADAVGAERLGRLRLPSHHPERAVDAFAVLRACTYESEGSVVASPTTSLPEAPGGTRQFDYRFTWLRDASLAVSVAALLGDHGAAESYLRFVVRLSAENGMPTAPVTDVRGAAVPAEREVDGVAGWSESRPVRVGNAAAGQVQFDALGLLLEAISVYLQTGGTLDDATWSLVRAVADHAATAEAGPSNGIWEFREPRDLIDADIGRWLALDRAVWITRGWRPLAPRKRWKQARDRLAAQVLDAIQPDGLLPQSYGAPSTADAAALMAVIFGLLPRGDDRAAPLVDAIVSKLDAWPFLYRYRPDDNDGFVGREAPFLPVSWWAVAALAATGRLEEAERRVDAMCSRLPRLLAEEFDPAQNESLGNVPLVWSHMEAARVMYLLDAARRRARVGAVGLWGWRLARFGALVRARRSDPGPMERPLLEPSP